MTTTAIGRHEATRTGDVLRITFAGPLLRSDLEALRVLTGAMLETGGLCFMIADMRGCTGIEAEARKYMAEWSKAGHRQLSGTAMFGLSFAIRSIVSLTLSAIRFLGRRDVALVFVKDEDEAHAWVATRRRELAATSA